MTTQAHAEATLPFASSASHPDRGAHDAAATGGSGGVVSVVVVSGGSGG